MKINCPYTRTDCLTPYRCEFDLHCRKHAMEDVAHPLMYDSAEQDSMVSDNTPIDLPRDDPPPFQGGGGEFGGAGASGSFDSPPEPDPAPASSIDSGGGYNPDN